jgi:CheY-like chemotaxis protein
VTQHDPAAATRAPMRILIADDNRDAAEALSQFLARTGHSIFLAYDGRQAIELANQLKPEVAVLDIGMPEIDGYEVARRLRAEAWSARLVLVAVTGWGQAHDKNEAFAAGFNHHFTKPIDPGRLESLLAEVNQENYRLQQG